MCSAAWSRAPGGWSFCSWEQLDGDGSPRAQAQASVPTAPWVCSQHHGEAEIHPSSKWGLVTVRSSSHVPTVRSGLTLLTPCGAPAGGTWKGARVWNYWWRGLGLRGICHSCNNTSHYQVESVGSPRFIYPTDERTPGLYGPSEGSSVGKECLPRAMAPSKGWNKKKLLFRAN